MSDSKLPFIFARFKPGVKVSRDNIDCWVVIISEPVFEYGFEYGGYECSTKGDKRFSAFNAILNKFE